MSKRRRPLEARYPSDWVVETEISVHGRRMAPGTELSIRGERGRFIFIKRVTTSRTTWIDVVGGTKGHAQWRSFGEDRVRTVHRIAKTRANQAKAV